MQTNWEAWLFAAVAVLLIIILNTITINTIDSLLQLLSCYH